MPGIVSGLVHPDYVHGIFVGLIHSKNWGELTRLRFLGSSPPSTAKLLYWISTTSSVATSSCSLRWEAAKNASFSSAKAAGSAQGLLEGEKMGKIALTCFKQKNVTIMSPRVLEKNHPWNQWTTENSQNFCRDQLKMSEKPTPEPIFWHPKIKKKISEKFHFQHGDLPGYGLSSIPDLYCSINSTGPSSKKRGKGEKLSHLPQKKPATFFGGPSP